MNGMRVTNGSVGGEVLTSVGDWVNSYTALSDTETVNGAEETALDGMDMELAVPLLSAK